MVQDEDAVEFVPDVGENRDLSDDEQVWAEILPMTGEELRAYQRGMANVKPNSRAAFEKAGKILQRIMTERVLTVHNYEDIKGKPIENGAEVYNRGEASMMDALYAGLTEISTLREGQRKK